MTSPTALKIVMSEEETNAILTSASDCAEGECSIDDVTELIHELKGQQKVLTQRLENIMNMVAHLQKVNTSEKRETDEVRQYVRDLLRVFSSGKSGFSNMGYTGDVGDGPTTAYDALPPKKWTAKK
mmetsp:Transcript_13277/g.24076  ORF Transcript_13277/g.24076 Transcript_13277/m.24076 type:complete len:126 (-) Transcript_13277:132-509(-)